MNLLNYKNDFYYKSINYLIGVILKFKKLLFLIIINKYKIIKSIYFDPFFLIKSLSYFRDNSVIFLESSNR